MDLTRDLGTDWSEFGSMKRQIRPYFKIRMQGNLRHRYVKQKMTHITVEQYVMTFKGIKSHRNDQFKIRNRDVIQKITH